MSQKTVKRIARVLAIILVVALVVTTFSYLMVFAGEDNKVYGATLTPEEASYANDPAYFQRELMYFLQLVENIKTLFKDNITYKELMDGAVQGLMGSLEDPYSAYYEKETGAGEAFIQSVSGEYGGIGIQMEELADGSCRIVSVFMDSPAEKAGVKAGDLIVSVEGKSVKGKTSSQVSSMLKGDPGSKVSFTVDRNGAEYNFTMVRAKVSMDSVSHKLLDGNIGYVQITGFDKDCDQEFARAWASLQKGGAESLIIDLRNNGGGYVNTAVQIADQLVKEGPLVYFAKGPVIQESIQATGKGGCDVPIVVLVNENTASASEILAAALRDGAGAKLVGATTFGKGVSQGVWTLSNGDTLKLSTEYFLTPKKQVINEVGLTPDYMVSSYQQPTLELLKGDYDSFAPMSEKREYSAGQVGLNVYGAQQRLTFLGFETKATGTMDEATVASLKAFQKAEKMFISGRLDDKTRTALEDAAKELIAGMENDKDLQLEKALEILK